MREGSTPWRTESGQGVFSFALENAESVGAAIPFVPRKAKTVPADDAEQWYERGCELEHSAADEAQQAYRRALELDPRHAGARVNLGRLLHEAGHAFAAATQYRLALGISPGDPIAAFNLGVALEDLGRLADAIAAYEQALAADPDAADAHFNLARLFEKEGKAAAAIRHLKAYRKLTLGR